MIIASLDLECYGPHRDLALDLADARAVGIYGPNGAGKSTILDSVGWLLHGRTRSSSVASWKTRGERRMRGALVLRGPAGDLRVERSWEDAGPGTAGRGRVRVSGWEGAQSRHAQRDGIERATGLTWDDYLATVCLAQTDLQRLATLDPGARRALVESWLARPSWAGAREALRRLGRAADLARAVAGGEFRGARDALDRAVAAGERWAKAPAAAQAEADLVSAEAAVARAEAERPSRPGSLDALGNAAHAALRELQEARAVAGGEFGGDCPVVRKPCPAVDWVRGDAAAHALRLEAAKSAYALAQIAHSAASAEWVRVQAAWEARARAAAAAARRAAEAVAAARGQAEAGARIRADLAEAQRSCAAAQEWEAAFGRRVSEVAAAAAAVDGVAAAEVEESIDEVEAAAGSVLRALGSPLGVRFSHARELKRWAPRCASCGGASRSGQACGGCAAPWPRARREALDVVVEVDGAESEFDGVGGGQRDLVSLALRLAFARRKGELRFLLCDEVLRQLDGVNRRAVAQYLLGGGVAALGVDQVLLVAHDPSAIAAAPRLLRVEPGPRGATVTWDR